MICKKCGGEMEARCASTNPTVTTYFCPMCGTFETVGSIEIQRDPPRIFGIGRMCFLCGETDEPGMRAYRDWICPECAAALQEIVMERRKARTEEKREEV